MSTTDSAPRVPTPALAWLWLLIVLGLAIQQIDFWRHPRIDNDVMALLPGASDDPVGGSAFARIADLTTGQVVILLGHPQWEKARAAAETLQQHLSNANAPLAPSVDDLASLDQSLALYAPHRRGLLTAQQRHWLQSQSADALAASAIARLYAPGPSAGLASWQDDPLGLWPDWWQARLGQRMRLRDGLIALHDGATHWALLRFNSTLPPFQLNGQSPIDEALDLASAQARQVAGDALQILRAGVPLHAEAAAARASWEVNTIGLGSLAAVLLLCWVAFRSVRPILLIALSLLIGSATGVAVTALVFGHVHLLTLVFGASLVGVAEDYGIHWFASRQAQPRQCVQGLLRQLLPGLMLALLTSVIAYLALGLAPFPGLRQMAVFSASGLCAAFLTVVLWFPWVDRRPIAPTSLAHRLAHSLARWPRWRFDQLGGGILGLALLGFVIPGLPRLQSNDSLRALQSSAPALLQQEQAVGRLLGLPSPAQFFIVTGADAEQVREREETLTDHLRTLAAEAGFDGYRAVSDWLPSTARQQSDQSLALRAETASLQHLGALLDEPLATPSEQAPLTLDAWLQHPASETLRPLWLGEAHGKWASVVLLQGLSARSDLASLAELGNQLPGVRWVDRSAQISSLLGHYRQRIGALLCLGYVAVAVALWWRLRAHFWRALLPTVIAALVSLASLGWLGEPLHLFNVMAQILLLGIGIDYGIFLVEHRDDPASWLAVTLGAASTLLAFGLLALSATPALHAFGLTLLIGITVVWALSPCFRPPAVPSPLPPRLLDSIPPQRDTHAH